MLEDISTRTSVKSNYGGLGDEDVIRLGSVVKDLNNIVMNREALGSTPTSQVFLWLLTGRAMTLLPANGEFLGMLTSEYLI